MHTILNDSIFRFSWRLLNVTNIVIVLHNNFFYSFYQRNSNLMLNRTNEFIHKISLCSTKKSYNKVIFKHFDWSHWVCGLCSIVFIHEILSSLIPLMVFKYWIRRCWLVSIFIHHSINIFVNKFQEYLLVKLIGSFCELVLFCYRSYSYLTPLNAMRVRFLVLYLCKLFWLFDVKKRKKKKNLNIFHFALLFTHNRYKWLIIWNCMKSSLFWPLFTFPRFFGPVFFGRLKTNKK